MKTTAPKTTATLQRQPKPQEQGPFFRKEGQGAYAVNGAQTVALDAPSSLVSTKKEGSLWGSEPFFQPTLNGNHSAIQAKLTIGQPNDKYEQEADRMAEMVVDRAIQNGHGQGNGAAAVQAKDEKVVQQKPIFESEEEAPENSIQEKPIFESEKVEAADNGVQTKCEACEQEEQVQKKGEGEHAEEEPVQTKEEELNENSLSEPALQLQEEEKEEAEIQEEPVQEKAEPALAEEHPAPEIQSSAEPSAPTLEPPLPAPAAAHDIKLLQPKEEEEETPEQEQELRRKPVFESAALPPDDEGQPAENTLMAQSENGELSGTDNLQTQLDSTQGGAPLPDDTRSEMESGFGADFSNVRIHTGSQATEMNQGLHAQAFTHGSDIYFNEGKYDPESGPGKKLLAHELTHTVQQGASGAGIQRKPEDHIHPEDGGNVKSRTKGKIEDEVGDDADFNKSEASMTAEEKEKARNIDQSKKREQKSEIKTEGIAEPDIDRQKNEKPKVKDAGEEGKKQLEESPEQKGQEKDVKKKGGRADTTLAEEKERSALAAYARMEAIKLPEEPPELEKPKIEPPKDKEGDPLPSRPDLDKAVLALHEIAKLFVENAYDFKKQAASDHQEGERMRVKLDETKAKIERVKTGSNLMKTDLEVRREVNQVEEDALAKVETDTAMVKEEAPRLMKEAEKGKDEAGPMVEESKEQKKEMEEKKPDDPDAAKDAEKQSQDTEKTAEDSQTLEEAMTGSGERAEQYLQDAVEGEKKNEQTKTTVEDNKTVAQNTEVEIDRIGQQNAQAEAQINALDHFPELVAKQTAERAETGEQLYHAGITMNEQLMDIQDEYYDNMSSIPDIATFKEEQAKAEANPPEEQPLSFEEELLIQLSQMDEEELDATLMGMDEEELNYLNSVLNNMPTQEEEESEENSILSDPDQAGRQNVDLGKLFESGDENQQEQDPRSNLIGEVENIRADRIGEVKKISDTNFVYLTAGQKMMLSQKLAMKNAVTGMFGIEAADMALAMLKGLVDPRESLKGVLQGANKIATGLVNLVNLEAWKKDPIGNLIQSAADIANGLVVILGSITGLAIAITILMAAITVASLGFALPFTAPVMTFMGTIISTVGGWTVAVGLVALELNALAYIKNLFDAGVAENTDELIFESDQIKQNMTDGFTAALEVIPAKMAGPVGKIANKIGGKLGQIKMVQRVGGSFKKGAMTVGDLFKRNAARTSRFMKGGATKVRGGITKALSKLKGGTDEGLETGLRKSGGQVDETIPTKTKNVKPGPKTKPKPDADASPQGKKVAEMEGGKKAEIETHNNHKCKVLEDGQLVRCTNCKSIKSLYDDVLDDPNYSDLKSRLNKLESQINYRQNLGKGIKKKQLRQLKALEKELLDKQVDKVYKAYLGKWDKGKGKFRSKEAIRKELSSGKKYNYTSGKFGKVIDPGEAFDPQKHIPKGKKGDFYLDYDDLNRAYGKGKINRDSWKKFMRDKYSKLSDADFADQLAKHLGDKIDAGTINKIVKSGKLDRFNVTRAVKNSPNPSQTLNYLSKLDDLAANGINVRQVVGDLAAGGNKFDGANFVLDFIEGRGIWDDVVGFEIKDAGLGRRYDLEIGNLKYEFKSIEVSSFTKETWSQMEKDIPLIMSGDMKWTFNSNKVGQQARQELMDRIAGFASNSPTFSGKSQDLIKFMKHLNSKGMVFYP
ncbi:MAG: DUF4157 domain-containing protein [Lewinellaceae bacterium]|nr:DUF4157 domain-containing protein [Phaeodactylibacter sp.]MCB9265778.1 DUF4157 domain-containing protein [Lewinellaceae bacterium]